jgi:hypothetical protein
MEVWMGTENPTGTVNKFRVDRHAKSGIKQMVPQDFPSVFFHHSPGP